MPKYRLRTISDPEFINLSPLDINPLISKCEIKVFYLGPNRNNTLIDKDTATEMSTSLRGSPIVGYFKQEKGDFEDHGEIVTIEGSKVTFGCKTIPYGFVAPDAKVWFQSFEQFDDEGNSHVREYLMTEGYLWTGQYPECKSVVDEGRPQSMELDKDSLNGYWSENVKPNMEFFIINDAIFSKLCILGEDVEPCFEGASLYSNNQKTMGSTLYTMMKELETALKGGKEQMDENLNIAPQVTPEADTPAPEQEAPAPTDTQVDSAPSQIDEGSADNAADSYTKEDKKEDKPEDKKDNEADDMSEEEKKKATQNKCGDDDENKKKYSLLEEQCNTLKSQLESAQATINELNAFKLKIEQEEKQKLIGSFYMLSEEDKQDVITNIDKYSLDEIEAKLSVICVRKKVNFNLEDSNKNNNNTDEENPTTTFNLNSANMDSTPGWIKSLRNTKI